MVVFVGDYCEGYYENMAVRNHQQSVVEIRRYFLQDGSQ